MVKTKESIAKFLCEPANAHLKKMNSFALAKKLGVKEKLIIETREYMKNIPHSTNTNLSSGKTVEEKVNVENGTSTVTKFVSSIPPTLTEIKKLFHIDDVNTQLITYWNKAVSGGFYLSCHIRVINKTGSDFDIDERIKSALKGISPISIKKPSSASDALLVIVLSDDHAGLIIKNSIFDNSYSGSIYAERLDKVLKDAVNLDETFEKVVVLRLGDDLDGWNGETTRGGHKLGSLSNEEQFDIYTSANMSFYDSLFTSGLGFEYEVVQVVNSNHSGNGFSYIVNKALQFYVNAKFPSVKFTFENKFISHFEWGNNHVIAYTHGKDESTRKKPMPYNLDKDTDLYLCEYFDSKDYSLKKTYITLYKGDLHQFGVSSGKFGCYVNCPSIAGSSAYSEINYGSVNPSAVLAIHRKDRRIPTLINVDFNTIDE